MNVDDAEFIRKVQNVIQVDRTEGKAFKYAKMYMTSVGINSIIDIPKKDRRKFFLNLKKEADIL